VAGGHAAARGSLLGSLVITGCPESYAMEPWRVFHVG